MKGNRSAKKSELSEQVTEMLENEVDSNPNGEKVLANEGAKNGNPQENALVQGVENPQDDNTMSMKNGKAIDNKPEDKQVVWVPVEMLDPHSNHVFKIRNDDAMSDLVENIRQHGVVAPILVREKNTGRYEIISGHRRALASRLLGLDTVPVIVMDLDDDQAELLMVLKGILRQKKRLHYERVDLLVFDMDVYSDWDIYACPDDIY